MSIVNSKILSCGHYPSITKVIFAIGKGKTATYDLCILCKSHPVYQNHIVSVEDISHGQMK